VVFNEALLLDSQLEGGAYSVGTPQHLLDLPAQYVHVKERASERKGKTERDREG